MNKNIIKKLEKQLIIEERKLEQMMNEEKIIEQKNTIKKLEKQLIIEERKLEQFEEEEEDDDR